MGCTKQSPSQLDRNGRAWPCGRSVDHLGLALVGAGSEGDPRHHGVGGGADRRGQDQEKEEGESGRHCGWGATYERARQRRGGEEKFPIAGEVDVWWWGRCRWQTADARREKKSEEESWKLLVCLAFLFTRSVLTN